MDVVSDINTFAKVLTDKGYSGYFYTQGAYPGKLKDSISEFLQSYQKIAGALPKQSLLLTGYLKWSGENKPHVICNLWVKHQNGKLSLERMDIEKKDCFGHLLKKVELNNLSLITVPKITEAIALVTEKVLKQEISKNSKRLKR